jgi:hypothetical protein
MPYLVPKPLMLRISFKTSISSSAQSQLATIQTIVTFLLGKKQARSCRRLLRMESGRCWSQSNRNLVRHCTFPSPHLRLRLPHLESLLCAHHGQRSRAASAGRGTSSRRGSGRGSNRLRRSFRAEAKHRISFRTGLRLSARTRPSGTTPYSRDALISIPRGYKRTSQRVHSIYLASRPVVLFIVAQLFIFPSTTGSEG